MFEQNNACLYSDLFRLCPPPSLVGAYYLHPPDARAIFLHSNLLCNGTCSVTGGRITYWGGGGGGGGGHKRKRSLYSNDVLHSLIKYILFITINTHHCTIIGAIIYRGWGPGNSSWNRTMSSILRTVSLFSAVDYIYP